MSRELTVSPDTVIRFKLGKIWVHSAATPARHIVVEHMELLNLLNAFARPQNTDTVLSQYPPAARATVAEMLSRLESYGILVDTQDSDESARDAGATDAAHMRLAELANAVYDIASDFRGLGADGERALREKSGSGMLERVSGISAAVDGLADELRALVDDHLAAQLERLGIAPGARNLKLHIGAGGHELPGWVNIDVAPAELAMNIKWGLPFDAGAADYVFMSHLFEHLFYPREAIEVLKDIARVLAPGGTLRIIVPDVEKCIAAYASNDRRFFDRRKDTWDWWPEANTRLEDFLTYAGAGPEPGRLFDAHKFGYDFETLSHALTAAGFASVRRCEYMQSPHETLRVDDASLVAGAKYDDDEYYSLFVEATR